LTDLPSAHGPRRGRFGLRDWALLAVLSVVHIARAVVLIGKKRDADTETTHARWAWGYQL